MMKKYILIAAVACCSSAVAAPQFYQHISKIPKAWQAQMLGRSWQKKCPVPLNQLSYMRLSYWGYDHKPHIGTLIVNQAMAKEVAGIFKKLYQNHFPIQEMKPYATYPVGEYAKHNDTVGFYCRPAQDDTSHFSKHSYGIAIDVNPLVNPYYDYLKKSAWPKQGSAYMNRQQHHPGMIRAGDKTFMAFTDAGWQWGGFWQQGRDYMHFQKMIDAHYVVNRLYYRSQNVRPTVSSS